MLLSKTELDDLNRFFYNSKFQNYRWAKTQNFHFDLLKLKEEIQKITKKFNKKDDIIKFDQFIKEDSNFQSYLTKVLNGSQHLKEPYSYFIYNINKIVDGFELYNYLYGEKSNSNGLIKLRSSKDQGLIERYKHLYYLKIDSSLLLNDIVIYMYSQQMQFPFINFRFDPPSSYQYYHERKYEQKFHIGKMKKRGLFKEGNERDKLSYIIENKLDSYYNLFNPVNFFYKTKVTSTEKYYNIMFPRKDKKDIINKYIQGFDWILNYYFNNKTDILWFYPYPRTPLLSDVVKMYDQIQYLPLNFNTNRI